MQPFNYLEGLNERQKEAVLAPKGPLMILAGAGAGKTKTITHRIAHFIATGTPSDAILAVTFTNKAGAEMRERVEKILHQLPEGSLPLSAFADSRRPTVSTFHSLGVRILREHSQVLGIPRTFSIWDKSDSSKVVKSALQARELEKRFEPKHVLGRISKNKSDGISLEEYANNIKSTWDEVVTHIWREYEDTKRKEGALDFDDLLVVTLELLAKDPVVRNKLQNRWTHLLVDEYQDTNRVQYEIARLLAGHEKNITVVGDIDQNIYSWRGADIAHLLSFEKSFPGARMIMLEENYRSTKTIVGAANGVIAHNKNRFEKVLTTANPQGEPIDLYYSTGETDEAQFVAKTAQTLIREGAEPKSIAVLYRANFQSRVLEEAFLQKNVPYRLLGTKFFDRAEVKDVLSYLRAALNPQSRTDIARIIGSPPRGIGKATLTKMLEGGVESLSGAAQAKAQGFYNLLSKINACAEREKPSETLKFIIRESGLETHLLSGTDEDKERLLNAQELVTLATKYDAMTPLEGCEKLLEEASLMSDQDELTEEMNSVSLMTVHASKGLEFDTVFITGLEEGLFPMERDEDEGDKEEERRLFYVALTRARKKVYLTSAATRMMYGNREMCTPSQFLGDIEPGFMRAAFGGMQDTRPKNRYNDYEFYDDEETIF